MKRSFVFLAVAALLAGGCSKGDSSESGLTSLTSPFTPAPPDGSTTIPTQAGNYNYSPAVLEEGGVIKAWWCSATPKDAYDQIWYQEYDKASKTYSKLQAVLNPGAGKDWDTFGVCHPTVIRGSWPGGPNGQSWTYAMYYVSTNDGIGGGTNNSIGVVFSMDGIAWDGQHAPRNPMIRQKVPNVKGNYGAGLPSAWSRGGSEVTMFWTDTTGEKTADPQSSDGFRSRVLVANSTDGIKFSAAIPITQEGGPAYWKNDFAFDDSVQPAVVYSAQALTFRSAEAPAKNETYNFGLYKMPMDELLAGGGRWEELGFVDTNLTGLPLNFEPGLVRTGTGKIAVDPNKEGLEIWFGGGGQVPTSWGLHKVTVKLGPAKVPLRRYSSGAGGSVAYWTTTGFVPPSFREGGGGDDPETLGYLDLSPTANQAILYGCQAGPLAVNAAGELTDAEADRFVSLDGSCPGGSVLGFNGYLFTAAPAGVKTKPLYACRDGKSRFVSNNAKCDGKTVESPLGFARAE